MKFDKNTPVKSTLEEFNHLIGERLKILRNIRGVTQSDLATILGVSYQQIQKYETGKSPITAAKLAILGAYLGANISYFTEDLTPDKSEDRLVNALRSLRNPDLRDSILDLIEAIIKNPDERLAGIAKNKLH